MLRYIDSGKMGRGQHGWLDSHFHFSFAEYCNPDNVQFGVLRVMNDDQVQSGTGFEAHSHKNMEIISYVVEGELTHADSMKNEETLTRGQVQYMSAGTGVQHSEFNHGKSLLRFFQIWILPDRDGYPPNYGSRRFAWEDRRNKWLFVASEAGKSGDSPHAPIRIHADVNICATLLDPGKSLDFKVGAGRQAYLALIEGEACVNGVSLSKRDALEIAEEDIRLAAAGQNPSHALILEMAKA
ncbi:MAG: pirin family protein [Synergistaceae bacterium]|jgi:redox-sensitive bicupin YhaK (pirin superfamily)|nr:pirin family protein [Synergistaceae bacterium]